MSDRADVKLVEMGLAASRARAQAEIAAGNVLVDGKPVTKASQKISPQSTFTLKAEPYPWVSRGAEKLLKALDHFKLSLDGRYVLDLGASTGGFTQVALARGAAHVVALDVGHGQLNEALSRDPRVTNLEGVNIKDLERERLAAPLSAIVTDVSFISLTKALPKALAFAAPGCLLIALIKPQFEVGKQKLGRGGIVKDAALHEEVCRDIETWVKEQPGWRVLGLCDSPIQGGDGNKEFLIAAIKEN